jgi:hypothetical protein
MTLINPIIVIWHEDKFHANIPCLGEATAFVNGIIENEKLDPDKTEVFLYNRKEWIELLQLSKDKNKTFVIEKKEVKVLEDAVEEKPVDRVVDWRREPKLGKYYSDTELFLISENKQLLSEGVDLKDLPHKIDEVKVKDVQLIKVTKTLKTIKAQKLEVVFVPSLQSEKAENGEQSDSVPSSQDGLLSSDRD